MKRYLMMIKYRQYRWAARFTGILGMVFFISWFTAQGIADFTSANGDTAGLTFVFILVALCLIAYVLSWFAEIVGGTLLTTAAILLPLFVVFNEGSSVIHAVAFFGLPFFIPGLLFMIAWRIKVIRKEIPNGA
jgi:hypothetical protein